MPTLWEELNRSDVSIYWPALVFWLSFAVAAAFLAQETLFRDKVAIVKYTVAAPPCPDQSAGRIDRSSSEAETVPEVSTGVERLEYTLTRTRSAMATSFLVARQTAEAWDPR